MDPTIRIGPVQNNSYSTKIIWPVQNNFGPIEGQGISISPIQRIVQCTLGKINKNEYKIWRPKLSAICPTVSTSRYLNPSNLVTFQYFNNNLTIEAPLFEIFFHNLFQLLCSFWFVTYNWTDFKATVWQAFSKHD